MHQGMLYLIYFFIYSFLGWCCETMYCSFGQRKFINRGFLAGPYCPIYGCGAILVIYPLESWIDNPLLIFLFGVLITSILECITSVVMEMMFHTKWWDYSSYPFNIHGRVCLKNSSMFGILVMFVMYDLHPHIIHVVNRFTYEYQFVFLIVCITAFIIDGYITLLALLRKNQEFLELEQCVDELKIKFADMDLFDIKTPLHERISQVLNSSEADEKIEAILHHMHQCFQQGRAHSQKSIQRIYKAFPTRVLSKSRADIERIRKMLSQHYK